LTIGDYLVGEFNRASGQKLARLTQDFFFDHWAYFLSANLGEIAYDHTPSLIYRIHDNNEVGLPKFISKLNVLELQKYLLRTNDLIEMSQRHFESGDRALKHKLYFITNKSFRLRAKGVLQLKSRQKFKDRIIISILVLTGFFRAN
jgi:hypothetical protein